MTAAIILICFFVVVAAVAAVLLLRSPMYKEYASRHCGGSRVEDLAADVFEDVMLPWAGRMRRFKLRKVNVLSLIACGKFPNLLLTSFASATKKAAPEEVDHKKLAEENNAFLRELTRKSLAEPTFQELHDALARGDVDEAEMFPLDFLNGVLAYQQRGIEDIAKKKST